MVSLRSALSSASILVALFARDVLADNPINSAFPYGSTKVRGVNLGGWLVLEVSTHHILSSRCHRHPAPRTARPRHLFRAPALPLSLSNWALTLSCLHQPWITPSLFDNTGSPAIVDEWTFGQYQNARTAQSTLKQHWDTWITEQDFVDIAAAG